MDRIDRIRNWQDFVFWWQSLPDEQKGAAIAGVVLFGIVTALIANGKGRNPVGWFIFGAVLPLIGFISVLAVSNLRRRRDPPPSQTVYVQQPAYVPPQQASVSMGASSITDEIQEAKALLDDGTITKAEFEAIKAKLLGR